MELLNSDLRKCIAILVIGLLVLLPGMYALETAPKKYEYTVKAEQVTGGYEVSEPIPMENLSSDERDAIHRAFRKSDHFLGGGSDVEIGVNERLQVDDGWRVIEVQGVPILISFGDPSVGKDLNNIGGVVGLFGTIIGIALVTVAILGILMQLLSRRY